MKKLWEWFKRLFLDNEIYIRAAALTFFTLSGIIPVCILFIFVEEILMVDTSVSEMAGDIIPNINDSFDALCSYPEIRLDQLLENYGIIGDISIGRPVVIGIIIVCVYCFLNNLHGSFNYIWRSEDRTKDFWKCLGFNIKVSFITVGIIILSAVLYNCVGIPTLQFILLLLMMMSLIYLAYRWIPYGKHPHHRPSIIAAFIASFCLYLWSRIIPFVGEQLSVFQFNGISILLLIFWLYWGWFIVLTGARLCAYWSKRGVDYLREEAEGLSPVYRQHLLMLVSSYVFRNAGVNRNGSFGVSYKEIRNGISKFLPNGTAEHDDSFLPMILLDSIIKELLDRHIIQNYANEKEHRFGPCYEIDGSTFTVGDLLFHLNFAGGYNLNYPYYEIGRAEEEHLSSSLMKVFSGYDQKLIDILDNNASLSSHQGTPFSYEAKRFQYLNFRDSDRQKKLEDTYREELLHRTPEEIIENIRNAPATARYEPDKEFHIGLVQKLASEVSEKNRNSDIQAQPDDDKKTGGLVHGITQKLRKFFGGN